MVMQPGLWGSSYTGQGIGGSSFQPQQAYTQPLHQIAQSLQFVPYQLQQLQQVQLLQHQQVQQLLQIVPAQLQQLQQTLQYLAQQIPSLQGQQQFGQGPWALPPGGGYGTFFQPALGFGQQGQVM